MKGPRSFLVAAVALSSTVAAWPKWLPDLDTLVVRQDDSTTTTAEETGTTTSPTSTAKSTATTTSKTSAKVTTTNLNTGGQTKTTGTGTAGTDTETGTDSGTTEATTATSFADTDPAGGITMITPATTAGTALYRIGETITWAWNYTSLQGTPTAVDVLVSCSIATETWTLTQNMTFEPTGTYIWDTNSYAQTAVASPLLTEEYTLIIYDADSSISATAQAGYLSVYNQFTFGMYTARPYKDLGEWKCVTCSSSAANSNLDSHALRFAVGMATITALTFTWFVAGFGGL